MAKNNPQPDASHEALCRRCGRCCFLKVTINFETYVTPFPCQHLNLQTRLCKIYPNRKKIHPRCLTADQAISQRAFPADCPYVADKPDYTPPHEKWDEGAIEFFVKEFRKLAPAFLGELQSFAQSHPDKPLPIFKTPPPHNPQDINWEFVGEHLRAWLKLSPYSQLCPNDNNRHNK